MWVYQQSTGHLTDPSGALVANGYSGYGAALNDPSSENQPYRGPIPAGTWRISSWTQGDETYENKGPVVAQLTPVNFDPHGRSGFLIHGDNAAMNHTASHGCIILPRPIREQMRTSGDTDLTVIA